MHGGNIDPTISTFYGILGLLMATKWPFMAFLGHFGALWRPPMAISDPGKGSNTSPWMCLDLIQPRSTLIHQLEAARGTDLGVCHFQAILSHFWGPQHLKSDQIFKKRWAHCSTIIFGHFKNYNALWGVH